jgi:MauM/NapG family ferredoxin protein
LIDHIRKFLEKLAGRRPPLRPPGAVLENEFEKQCIRCRKCVEVCPYDSILVAHGEWGTKVGTPIIYAREVPCYLCMECPPVCPSDALLPITQKEKVKMGLAALNETTCLPFNGVICRACYERCPIYREAITLREEIYPTVHADKCTGCGICENVCPTNPASILVDSKHFSSI